MKFFYRLLPVFFCVILLVGCGGSNSFTWKLDRVPTNLDPQLAAESPELIAVTNMYSGLTRIDENGKAVLDCASDYTVSDDGLTYTFTLKDDLRYTKLKRHKQEYELTAHDFVFGMQRVFLSETNSPYTAMFSNLKNAQAILNGQADISQLGVQAPDDHTVVFQLEHPDSGFLEKLSQPGAMPCNQSFFEDSAGTYGLNATSTLANGPFYLYNWNENGLFLRRSAKDDFVTSLRLVIDNEESSSGDSPAPALSGSQKVQQGLATGAIDSAATAGSLPSIPYTATTWVLSFNVNDPQLSSAGVRLALGTSASRAITDFPQDFSAANGLIPPAIEVDGESYRGMMGSKMPTVNDIKETCRSGLAASGLEQFKGIQILVPEGEAYQNLMAQINQQWQQDLGAFSAYFSIKAMPLNDVIAACAKNDYQIALLPFSPVSNDGAKFLQQFQTDELLNSEFGSSLTSLLNTLQPSAEQIAQTESLLLQSAPVYPLWFQDQALILASGVQHVVFRPFGPVVILPGLAFPSNQSAMPISHFSEKWASFLFSLF